MAPPPPLTERICDLVVVGRGRNVGGLSNAAARGTKAVERINVVNINSVVNRNSLIIQSMEVSMALYPEGW